MDNRAKRVAREHLAADVARFLGNGGRVTKLKNGDSANQLNHVDPNFVYPNRVGRINRRKGCL